MKFYRIADLPRWLRDIVPLLLVMSAIYWLSSRSVLVVVEGPMREKLFFKSAHMIAYATLAWCWWRALAPQRQTGWPVLLAALGLTILYGISDEIHQLFVPGRHGQVTDVLFDATGALVMILLIRRLSPKNGNSSPSRKLQTVLGDIKPGTAPLPQLETGHKLPGRLGE